MTRVNRLIVFRDGAIHSRNRRREHRPGKPRAPMKRITWLLAKSFAGSPTQT
jgi:hypothetical protein